MSRSLLLAVLALAACAGRGHDPPLSPAEREAEIAELCRTTRCREPTTIRIPIDSKHDYEVDFPRSPWVVDDTIVSILPGETLHLEAELAADGRIARLRAVDQVQAPERTVTLVFTIPAQLEVKNPFDRPLRFELGMQLAGRDGLYKTSSCPAVPRGSAVELWHDPIVQLIVARLRLLADGDSTVCE